MLVSLFVFEAQVAIFAGDLKVSTVLQVG